MYFIKCVQKKKFITDKSQVSVKGTLEISFSITDKNTWSELMKKTENAHITN